MTPSSLPRPSLAARRIVASVRADLPVWLLTLAIVAGAVVLDRIALHGIPATTAGQVPWWALIPAFALTERFVVHIHFRSSAHSLSLSEVPLVLGLLFGAPSGLALAQVAGAGAVLATDRRQSPVRLGFNLAQFAFAATVASSVFHGLVGNGAALEPATWGAALGGALAGSAVSTVLISIAISVTDHQPVWRRLGGPLGMAAAVTLTNSSLALAAASVLAADARAALFLIAPAAAMILAYQAYLSERRKHEGLELLYRTSRILGRAPGTAAALAGLLAEARDAFRCEVAEVCVTLPGAQPERTTLGPADRLETMAPLDEDEDADRQALLGDRVGAVRVPAGAACPALRRGLDARGVRDAVLAPLIGEDGLLGTILIGNRSEIAGPLTDPDLRLLETLASQIGATLDQDHLERKISDLRELQAGLEHKAFHDPLTGLANRLLFEDRVRHALSRRTGSVVVFYIDLDNFKRVNDTHGHDAGDALLCEVAERLRQSLRTADTPGRLGGDEFAVLLVDILEADARMVAGRVSDSLNAPYALDEVPLPGVGASVGMAMAPSGSMSSEELLRRSDAAMYAAKHGGKGRVSFSVLRPTEEKYAVPAR